MEHHGILKKNLSATVRALRHRRKASLEEFSEELGIGRSTLQDIEAEKSNATLGTVQQIADQLGISPLVLLGELENPIQPQLEWEAVRSLGSFCDLPREEQRLLMEKLQKLSDLLQRERVR